MKPELNLHSARTQKAKIAAALTPLWRGGLASLAIILLVGGLALVVTGQPFGWILAGLAVLPAMVVEWFHGELQQLAAERQPTTLDGILDQTILAHLSASPTPKEVAALLGSHRDALFFASRFGVGGQFIVDIASESPEAMDALWREALAVRERAGLDMLSAGTLVVALVRLYPNHQSILAHIQLTIDELERGLLWQRHIYDLIREHGKKQRTGGLARDWSFGYTPLLSRFGQVIGGSGRRGLITTETASHREALERMVATFGSGGRQNVVLVGGEGVGKTTLVYAFSELLLDPQAKLPAQLQFQQVVMLDASSLVAAASGRGELEQLLTRIFNEAYLAKNIILCLDNAQAFFEDGIGSIDMSSLLLPILEAGRLRMVLTVDEQRLLQIAQRNPSVANTFNKIVVEPASEEETIRAMQDQLIVYEFQHKVTYMYQALAEAYRLSTRYVHDLAMPGRAIKLLESAANYAEKGLVTASSVAQAIEKTSGVKVGAVDTDAERERLLNLETLIHKRMINQSRAVSVVSDSLRRARAGVRNQSRAIGTFLFLGPTGVGKTELAKALADVYFGGEDRIVRVDLNEYVQASDVSRLIADGAEDPGSLSARLMKQPFSVVLLDEIEKAHPQVLTTLLQVLDEGVLRDAKNREVSFRDAIIVATSNAGADRVREYIERGYDLEQFEDQLVNELIDTNQFRPEFLNRFDEIVVFRPLNQSELLQVVDLILAGINKTLAPQQITVQVEQAGRELLVARGYDPRLGARPMRRIVQKAVENTVARQMLSGEAAPGSTIAISREQIEQIVGKNEG